jgi:hypothetical protein
MIIQERMRIVRVDLTVISPTYKSIASPSCRKRNAYGSPEVLENSGYASGKMHLCLEHEKEETHLVKKFTVFGREKA